VKTSAISTFKQLHHSAGIFLLSLSIIGFLTGCQPASVEDPVLLKNTYFEMVDWHISGFGIINSPVAWVRIGNSNKVPIKDMVLKYVTYDIEGHKLDEGTFTIEETVQPGEVKNFIELYLGLVDLHTEQLRVELISVTPADE